MNLDSGIMLRLTNRRLILLGGAAVLAGARGLAESALRFTGEPDGGYTFNTGVLSGKLRSGGKSVGLLPVIHAATGQVLTSSMGFAGHYRMFSASRRFGTGAWYWPSTSRLIEDGSVEVFWPAADDRPFDMWAVYRWVGPAVLDVETRVRPQADLTDFEAFLAWYSSDDFNSASVLVRDGRGRFELIAAEQSAGAWQMFPRDDAAVKLIQDGRWKLPPNPVEWAIRPAFAFPIGVRTSAKAGLSTVLLAAAGDCFAVSTPYESDSHHSLYLSLFGRTIRAGETARARVRMIVTASARPRDLLRLYDDFKRRR